MLFFQGDTAGDEVGVGGLVGWHLVEVLLNVGGIGQEDDVRPAGRTSMA